MNKKSPIKRTQSNSFQAPYLFQAVCVQLTGKFWPILYQEVHKYSDTLKSGLKPPSSELFETFPRSNTFYGQMISDLSMIAKYDIRNCLNFLQRAMGEIITRRKNLSQIFDDDYKYNGNNELDYIRSFKIIFLTDLICTIVSNLSELDQDSSRNLINCGIYLCMSPPQTDDFPILLLKQWSVIFSYISKLCPSDLFERLTQLIINKYDLFFILMRYVRLDTVSKESHADDLLEIMTSHVKRAQTKKLLTSSMLVSISTILMTYKGESECIDQILEIARKKCQDNPADCPGAVDLVAILIHIKKSPPEEIKQFYEEKVYPLAKTKDGIVSAARAFRTLLFGEHIDPDFLFYVWSPSARTNGFEFLNWEVIEDKKQSDEDSFSNRFMKYFFPSDFFNQCSSIFRDILVRLAAMDFKYFTNGIFSQFAEKGIDSPQFMVFMNTVPMINDPKFKEHVSESDVNTFNAKFADTANKKMREMIESLETYGFFQTDDHQLKSTILNSSSVAVEKIFSQWKVETGTAIDFQVESSAPTKVKVSPKSAKVVRIIPYIINSPMFQTIEWMKSLMRLSALAEESVSKQAFSICQTMFQSVEQMEREQFIKAILEMIHFKQKAEIMFVCLLMLNYITDLLEPGTPSDDDAVEYQMEYVAFVSLASSFPRVRSLGYELLIKVNKLLQNQGLYSKVEDHINAIASNVKHNILLQTFPKHPRSDDFHEEELSLDILINSRYQDPWLFFLAEFGRIIVYSNYIHILERISGLCQRYEPSRPKLDHLDLGLLVIFFSTCTDNECIETNLYVYDMPRSSPKNLPSFKERLKTLMNSCLVPSSETNPMIYKAIKHSNYTIVPFVLKILAERDNITFDMLPSIHMMLSTIEGTEKIRQKVVDSLKDLFLKFCQLISKIDTNPIREYEYMCFLTFLNFFMETRNNTEKKDFLIPIYLLEFLTNVFQKHQEQKNPTDNFQVKCYTAWCLFSILSKSSFLPNSKLPDIVKKLSECERYGYHVLFPLLANNNCEDYLKVYIDSCFKKKSLKADAFFDAIYNVLPGPDSESELIPLYQANAGDLILLGLLRLKTGSPHAKNFLSKILAVYVQHGKTQEESTIEIDEKVFDSPIFGKVAEQVVKSALYQMSQIKFRGTVKVMVDILTPCIARFQLLPKCGCCVPSVNISGQRYTPNHFLSDLLKVTTMKKYQHDFQRLVELWACLITLPNHKDIVPAYISYIKPKEGADVRSLLFEQLLPKFKNLINKNLAKRCTFAYYAYIKYQCKTEFDSEFWGVSVLVKAIKRYPAAVERHIPILVHFAILFHSNQTQSLLKRLCKKYGIPYSRRTLSSTSIRKLVSQFEKKIKESELLPKDISATNSSEKISMEEEDSLENKKEKKVPMKPLDKWATEAMRWVVGSKNLKLAYTSIIILNKLKEYHVNQQMISDLLKGVCKSTAYFLKVCKDHAQIYDFIDEAFILFKRHFDGNENLAFSFINSFLTFVVSVDAYFEKLLPLYQKCLYSDQTKDEAKNNLLAALRPSFNELESDSMARNTFSEFVNNTNTKNIDLQFIDAALRSTSNDDTLIEMANNEQLNTAFLHFSLMVVNASADMKRRIFVLSSKIITKMENQRSKAKSNTFSKDKMMDIIDPNTVDNMNMNGSIMNNNPEGSGGQNNKGDDEESLDADKNDLNKQALVVIFKAAAQMLPNMKEALAFIEDISKFDPLIPTVPLIDEMEWSDAAKAVINELNKIGTQENATATLTNCKNLSLVSNLLNIDSSPKILPFHSTHDTLKSVIDDPKKKEPKKFGSKWFDFLYKKFVIIGQDFQKNIMSPHSSTARGLWEEPLKAPKSFIDDSAFSKSTETETVVACSIDEFLSLPP